MENKNSKNKKKKVYDNKKDDVFEKFIREELMSLDDTISIDEARKRVLKQ